LLNHPCPSFERRGALRGIWGENLEGSLGEFKGRLGIVEESLGVI
jgi:hypothetical protein